MPNGCMASSKLAIVRPRLRPPRTRWLPNDIDEIIFTINRDCFMARISVARLRDKWYESGHSLLGIAFHAVCHRFVIIASANRPLFSLLALSKRRWRPRPLIPHVLYFIKCFTYRASGEIFYRNMWQSSWNGRLSCAERRRGVVANVSYFVERACHGE